MSVKVRCYTLYGVNGSQGWSIGRFPTQHGAEQVRDLMKRVGALDHPGYRIDRESTYLFDVTAEEAEGRGYVVLPSD